jgi:hypothetical protein
MNRIRIIGTAIFKRNGFFSIDQIIGSTKIVRGYCRGVLALLCQEGIIRQIKKSRKEHIPGRHPTYAMIYRVIDRKKLIARIAPRRFKNTIQDRMWFIIWSKFKNNGSFNLHDLTVLAGATKNTARWYLQVLRRAGYILPSRKAGPGVEWQLTGKFGPERPYLDRSRRIKRDTKTRRKTKTHPGRFLKVAC